MDSRDVLTADSGMERANAVSFTVAGAKHSRCLDITLSQDSSGFGNPPSYLLKYHLLLAVTPALVTRYIDSSFLTERYTVSESSSAASDISVRAVLSPMASSTALSCAVRSLSFRVADA